MRDFKNLSNEEIHKIWSEELCESSEEIYEFRKELVRRHFVTWDEINTKFVCEKIINE